MSAAQSRHAPRSRSRSGFSRRASLLTTLLLICGAFACEQAAAAPIGALDGTFGGGIVELPEGTQLNGAAAQRDGSVVVTGLTNGISDPRLLVARFTPAGGLDPSFGSGGVVTGPLPVNATGAIGQAVQIQDDGRIVVAGEVRGASGADGMLVARLNPDGGFDPSFGGGGVVAALRGAGDQAVANAVAVRDDGEVVVGGSAAASGEGAPTAAILRLNAAGALISTSYLGIGEGTIEGLALQSDGKVALAGSRKTGQTVEAFIGRANPDGSRDGGFRGSGIFARQLARNGGGRSSFQAVAVQSDGRIVATGYAFDNAGDPTPGVFRVTARVDGAGNPDGSFGPDGVRYTSAAHTSDVNTQAATGGTGIVTDSGHVYTGGSWDEFGSSALAVQAQTAGGADDGAFGSGGQTIVAVRGYEAAGYGKALTISPVGLYLAGTSGNPMTDTTTGVVARFGTYPFAFPPLPVGTPPPPPPPAPAPPAPPSDSSKKEARFPAKIQVLRAGVRRGRLDVLARITGRATGRVKVTYASSGRKTTFTAPITKNRIRFKRKLPKKQRRKTTGIFKLEYEGNDRVRPDEVRLRAANGKAHLKRETVKIDGKGRLRVSGTISKRARGVVRIRLGYDTGDGDVEFLPYRAKIDDGKWSLTQKLPDDAAENGGQLSIQFTGYERRRMRGEQLAKAVRP